MKHKAEPCIYSNKFESFQIEKTDKEEIMNLKAITDISYFPLKKGTSIPLNKGTIESLLNDDNLKFRLNE